MRKERLILQVVLYMAVVQVAPFVWNSKLYTHLLFVQQAHNLGNVPKLSLHTDWILREKNPSVETAAQPWITSSSACRAEQKEIFPPVREEESGRTESMCLFVLGVGAVREVGWGGCLEASEKGNYLWLKTPNHNTFRPTNQSAPSSAHAIYGMCTQHAHFESHTWCRRAERPPGAGFSHHYCIWLTTYTVKPDSFKHPSKSSISYCTQILMLQHKCRFVV